MPTFREAIGDAAQRLICSGAEMLGELLYQPRVPLGLVEQLLIRRLAYNTQRLFCNRDPYDRPYRPGLCPILYNVTITYRITGNPVPSFNGTFTQLRGCWGPIGSASYFVTEADEPGGRQAVQLTLMCHGTEFTGITSGWFKTIFPPGEFHEKATIVILNVESVPANVNDDNTCGGTYKPEAYKPENHTYSVNITYDAGDTTNITIPLIGILGIAYFDIDGKVNIPITFKLNPTAYLNLDFDFEFSGAINLDTGDFIANYGDDTEPLPPPSQPDPPAGTPAPKPTSPVPPAPPGITEPPADPDDEEAERRLIAAVVTTTFQARPTRQTIIGQAENPDIYVPDLGVINFAISVGDGAVAWTNDIRVKNLRAYIPCPVESGAVQVKGTPTPGNEWVITPIYSSTDLVEAG